MFAVLMDWVVPLGVGAATGILSGFGVGGGTLLLVYLTGVLGMEQQLAQGINLLYFLPAAVLALPAHWKNGFVEKKALPPLILAGLVFAGGFSWLAAGMDTGLLRKIFGGFLILIGLSQFKK